MTNHLDAATSPPARPAPAQTAETSATVPHPLHGKWRRFGMLVLSSVAALGFFIATIFFVMGPGLRDRLQAAPEGSPAAGLLKWMVDYWYLIPAVAPYGLPVLACFHGVLPEGVALRSLRLVGWIAAVIIPAAIGLLVLAARWLVN